MERDGRNKVVRLIEAAVYAGAYEALAKEIPDASRGLIKLRDKHEERVKALCREICETHAQAGG
jgi:hypothetical protein